jgi:putative membrane protein
MSDPRRPAAFSLTPERPETPGAQKPATSPVRTPRAVKADHVVVIPAATDVFETEGADVLESAPLAPPPKRSWLGTVFIGALGILVSLAIGLWVDRLVRDLFQRADWLGWLAAGLAAIALVALLLILLRETIAILRLASVEKLRARGTDAVTRNDARAARALVEDLAQFVSDKPETARGRRAVADLRDEVIDGADLVRIAETDILAPLDARARSLILDTAKRVSVVTAVSPRALVDVLYVLYESGRLIRRLSVLYGGRPGTLGFLRLGRRVLAHLAITGSIAVGDSLVQQVIGHGLAARLSTRLGEGVVNGLMTVRIGIAAMETARPLAFHAVKRPGVGDFLSALAAFSAKKAEPADKPRV